MSKHYVLTGGAGFIGSNYAARLLQRGEHVTVYDNLSRQGAEENIHWLQETFGTDRLRVVVGDVRDASLLTATVRDADVVVHLAAQVAVTTSVAHPRLDFEVNALGTFNVLEAARLAPRPPIVLYSSTNKVYGGMEDVAIVEEPTRYRYADLPYGVPETQPLDFHSPYGCSKGAGDQYVRDYARIYGLRTVVFRQSCIYGPRQWGIEDQGWVAWFVIAALTGKPITIYGDGKQVRDVLYIDDLLDVFDAAVARIDVAAGEVYNIGGGPENAVAIWAEFGPVLERILGRKIPVRYGPWRPGDQRVYISDIRKAQRELGWRPRVPFEEGLRRLVDWVRAAFKL
ncbi:MAG: NAD-dependent epimerase/dehydratase family protein, partial [Chloroflexi bacterium]|nr:NAD-dependent epimerase/dehydratase family protein [Chloroflexota bacterium]